MKKDQFEECADFEAKNLLTGKIYKVRFTTDHPASSYGQAVMVIAKGPLKGQAVDRAFYEILVDAEVAQGINKVMELQEKLGAVLDKAFDKDGGTA